MKLYLFSLLFILSCGDGHHLDKNKAGFYLTAAAIKVDSFQAIGPVRQELHLSSNAQTLGESHIVSYEWEILDSPGSTGVIANCSLPALIYTGTSPRKRYGTSITINDLGGSDDIYVKHTVVDNFGNSVSAYFFIDTAINDPLCNLLDPNGYEAYIYAPFNGILSFDKNNKILTFQHSTVAHTGGLFPAIPDGTNIPEILHDYEESGSYQSEGFTNSFSKNFSNSLLGIHRGKIAWGNGSGGQADPTTDLSGEYVINIVE